MSLSNILIKPLISEKSQAATGRGDYTFLVSAGASKHQIGEAVAKLFGVKVLAVRTGKLGAKTKKALGTAHKFRTPELKKAVVRLSEKDKIELFETKDKKEKKETK